MLRFSESISFDKRLAPFDIRCSKAYAAMLGHIGLLDEPENKAIQDGLDAIAGEIEKDDFIWDTACEDVHMNIEQALTARTEAAAKLHSGRSRNDQVATDMRLFFKQACEGIQQALRAVQQTLVDSAEAHAAVYIPGYTHLQRAQPVAMAHHWLAYVEMLDRDYQRFGAVWQHANACPLGSGALAGSTLPIDREFLAAELGFVDEQGQPLLTQNSMDAVADRDTFIEFATACALCGTHFSRVAEDLILWSSAEFDFIRLPEAFTTGSSLMPQKRNPDSLELLRGKASRLQASVQSLFTLLKGLPLTYNRDLQEDKPPVFDSFDQTLLCLEVLQSTLAGTEVKEEKCRQAVADPALLATDLVDYLVERGVPFRQAHHAIGALVAKAEAEGVKLNALSLDQVQEIHPLFGEDWQEVFNVPRALSRRERVGMPGPEQINKQIARWRQCFTA